MEPRQTSPENFAPTGGEQQQSAPFEAAPAEVAHNVNSAERVEQRLGHQVESAAGMASQPLPTLPAPVSSLSATDTTTVAQSDDSPIVAADEDLIEKEWVDKAKKVIAQTKDDPFVREQQVKQLQIDYIKKRYGKAIGAPQDSAWGQ